MAKAHLFVLAFCCLIWISVAQREELKKMTAGTRKKCLAESGTPEDVVEDAELGKFPEDQNLGCYFKCVLEKYKMMNKDGSLNFKLMRKIIPEEYKDIGNQILDECVDTTGADRCDLAFKFNVCIFNANPVAYIVV